jgi:antitoxin VapB
MEAEMGMNSLNPTVERLAKELAAETGETVTSAIQIALEERLERLHRERDIAEKKRRIREIVERSGPTPPGVTSDHSDLYGDDGLPA